MEESLFYGSLVFIIIYASSFVHYSFWLHKNNFTEVFFQFKMKSPLIRNQRAKTNNGFPLLLHLQRFLGLNETARSHSVKINAPGKPRCVPRKIVFSRRYALKVLYLFRLLSSVSSLRIIFRSFLCRCRNKLSFLRLTTLTQNSFLSG